MSSPPPPPPIENAPKIRKQKNVKVNEKELEGVKLKKVDEKDKHYIFSLNEEDNPFVFTKGNNGNVKIELKDNASGSTESWSKYSDMLSSLFNHNVGVKNIEEVEYHWKVWHGCLGNENWTKPTCVAKTNYMSRADQKNYTNASEYLDDPEVLNEKMKVIADLIKKSKCCTIYSGAGISRGAGIPDYGSKAEDSLTKDVEEIEDPYDAHPTYSHYVLANLEKKGLVHHYVQQNHDGLPQKAGFPQEKMNEIHGAWYDCSNPVVQFSGKLRRDLYLDMIDIVKRTDFCICLGTSLSGMNADRTVKTPIAKFSNGVEGSLGSVIINLQMTPVDQGKNVSIRVWAKIDDAMRLLVKHLGIEVKDLKYKLEGDIITCPYNKKGVLDRSKRMILNLTEGQNVVVCQEGASNEGKIGKVIGKCKNGHYIIKFGRTQRRLGNWWMKTIKNGDVESIPIVNVQPKFKKGKKGKRRKK